MRPYVSVVTPTYSRPENIPFLIAMYDKQTYPSERRELVILDDSPEAYDSLAFERPDIRYFHMPQRLSLGRKRNILSDLAHGDLIICFDDDDEQSQYRIEESVTAFKRESVESVDLVGCSVIYVFYEHLKKIYHFGPYGEYHATCGTMGYTRAYAQANRFPEDVQHAEERLFTHNYTVPLRQLDPFHTILCIAHSSNTFDKTPLIPFASETAFTKADFA